MSGLILCVDDNSSIQKLIEKALGHQYQLIFASDGKEAIAKLDKYVFDVVLLDLMMPDISGYEVLNHLQSFEHAQQTFVIIISAKHDNVSKTTGYALGAINYLEKPFEVSQLKELVHSLMKRKSPENNKIIQVGEIRIDVLRHSVMIEGQSLKLTSNEFKLLIYLVEREGQVISREKLLQVIAPLDFEISDRVIDTHISSIRKKLSFVTEKVKIKAIYREGYTLIDTSLND